MPARFFAAAIAAALLLTGLSMLRASGPTGLSLIADAGASVSVSAARKSVPPFPPRPEEMVAFSRSALQLAPAATELLFTVPVNRWLVIREVSTACCGGWSIVQDLGGTMTERLPELFVESIINYSAVNGSVPHYRSEVGHAFEPGSRVLIQNGARASTVDRLIVVGYLVDVR